jgi:hypothetical protein
MIKIVKLEDKFFELDSNGKDKFMDVFMISYSDKPYLKYGDMILDDVKENMTCERIENFVNNVNNDIENLEERITNFTYREEVEESSQAYKYLKTIWRDIKLRQLID